MFQPAVNDDRARYAWEGVQAMSNGLSQGISNAGNAAGAALGMLGQQKAKTDAALGQWEAVSGLLSDPAAPPELKAIKVQMDAYEEKNAKNPEKIMSGAAVFQKQAQDVLNFIQQNSYLDKQMGHAKSLAETRAAAAAEPKVPKLVRTEAGYYQQNPDGSYTPALDPSGQPLMPPKSGDMFEQMMMNSGGAAPAAAAAAAAPTSYQKGRKYGGRTYLGGDPTEAASWQ